MPEFFVEILSEEIPARMQRRAAGDLKRLVTDHLVHAGLTYEGAYASATPRRLVLSVQGLPARSADRKQERKGPRVGAPQKALEGFLRAAGLQSIDEAEIVSDSKKGDFYVARSTVEGRDAVLVCADALGAAIKDFPWPVSMRWGAASVEPTSMRWVRPMTSIVATFGADNEDPVVVPVPINDVPVGDETVGHRFHAPGPIKVRRLDDYQTALAQAHVVVDLDRRREQIRDDARTAVFALGLELVDDDGLLEEVAGLVEWPVVLVGHFDETTLSLPDEVIRLTIRENQKCFVTRNPATGELANAFVLTANLTTQDGGEMVKKGNERVVRARLADARFFYEQDLKLPLDTHLTTLKAVTFHDKLGSQWDRVERIATLAERIAPSVGADPQLAARAARLAKADLATQMVGEFPELQGYMGRRYAMAAGEADAVAAAIETHYAPLGPKDDVPTEPVAIAVALADKLDQLFFLWAAGEKPTGSGDPFALRRAALGIIRIILDNTLRVPLSRPDGSGLIADAWARHKGSDPFDRLCGGETGAQDGGDQRQFLIERLIVQQRDNGVSADVVKAIIPALATIDLVDITNRIAALQTFLASDD
ncbi:MAG: glycine--tRNA ligase subunit beta, partial [Pseudomonadota bacterium]